MQLFDVSLVDSKGAWVMAADVWLWCWDSSELLMLDEGATFPHVFIL